MTLIDYNIGPLIQIYLDLLEYRIPQCLKDRLNLAHEAIHIFLCLPKLSMVTFVNVLPLLGKLTYFVDGSPLRRVEIYLISINHV